MGCVDVGVWFGWFSVGFGYSVGLILVCSCVRCVLMVGLVTVSVCVWMLLCWY